MGRWTHLTIEEREEIMAMRERGAGVRETARAIGRDPSTVSRELARNSCGGPYRASAAQRASEARRVARARPRALDDPGLRACVQDRILLLRWSPEQVAGRLALEAGRPVVSASTIRRAIRARELDTPELAGTAKGLAGRLRRKGRPPKKKGGAQLKGKIKVDRAIGERPEGAESRSRLGDWEADTVLGKAGGPCVVALVDRASRYVVGGLSPSRRSADVCAVMEAALAGQPAETVTPDRGKEFARWREVEEATGAEFYFALPGHPWQRGTGENTNGLLREYFPKRRSLGKVAPGEVQEAFDMLNTRPRKCLGYRTPYEVHYSTVLQLI